MGKTGNKKAVWRVTIRHQGKKMVEDFSNRKTPNAKSAVLKNAIKPPGYYTFSEDISGEIIFSRNRILITDWIKIGHARNQTKFP